MPQTYLITGASSGLGRALAEHCQTHGHAVIGTTRSLARARAAAPDFEAHGGTWLEVDVAAPTAGTTVADAMRAHNVSVLVNSAGLALVGTAEDIAVARVQHQLDVNYLGPLRLIKAAIPVLRARGGSADEVRGWIVNVSSGAGAIGRPARSAYAASKAALEALSESLHAELRPFGIRTLVVQPGAFRTPFAGAAEAAPLSAPYKGSAAAAVMATMEQMADPATMARALRGDPARAAARIWEAIEGRREMVGKESVGQGGREVLRVPLGLDCVAVVEEKAAWVARDLEMVRGWADCDFEDK